MGRTIVGVGFGLKLILQGNPNLEQLWGGRNFSGPAMAPCGGGLKFLELFGYFLFQDKK
jgi:hypothetical protein